MIKMKRFLGAGLLLASLAAGFSFVATPKAGAITGDDLRPGPLTPTVSRYDFEDVLAKIINILLIVAGIAAFLYLFYGGFMYLTAGSNDDQATNGRKAIINAIIGLVIIFLSYSLVAFVSRQLKTSQGGLQNVINSENRYNSQSAP